MDVLKTICVHFNKKNSLFLITNWENHNQAYLIHTFKMYVLNQDTTKGSTSYRKADSKLDT